MDIFTNEFLESIKAEIEKQLTETGSASRESITESLGLDKLYAHCISAIFKGNMLPEYKIVQRLGIVRLDRNKKSSPTKPKPITVEVKPVVSVIPLPEPVSSEDIVSI